MKRFEFNLEQLLTLRRRQRDWAETQLRKLAHEVDVAKLHLRECEQNLEQLTAHVDSRVPGSMKTLSSISQLLDICDTHRTELTKLQSLHAAATTRLRQTNAAVEALEILRSEKLDAHRKSEQKKLQFEQEFRSLTTWQLGANEASFATEEGADV